MIDSRSPREGWGIQPIILVGLDASPRRIGWCVLVDDVVTRFGTEHVSRTGELLERRAAWNRILNHIRIVEDSYKRDASAITIEAPYLGPNRQGSLNHARTIGQMQAFALASRPGAEHTLMQPTEWRKLVSIKMRGKTAAYEYANQCLNYSEGALSYQTAIWPDLDQDAADAICIAYATRMMLGS
jgi:hypothetical protein